MNPEDVLSDKPVVKGVCGLRARWGPVRVKMPSSQGGFLFLRFLLSAGPADPEGTSWEPHLGPVQVGCSLA